MAFREIRLILADPPNLHYNPYATSFPNIGLLCLAQYLKKKISNIEIRYVSASQSISDHMSIIGRFKPHLYGISISSPFAYSSYFHINNIKRIFQSILIICGGPHPTAAPEHVLFNSKADICCIGEGENVLLEIIQAFQKELPITKIPGTAVKDQNGKIVNIARNENIHKIDIIDPPAWDLVADLKAFQGCRKARGKYSTAIVASRGCPFKCVFCSNPVWRKVIDECRFRSPEDLINEVLLLYSRGIREIYIRSDEMNLNSTWAISVFDALAKLNLPDMHFQCNLRADNVTEELAFAMKQARCWLCHIGVESSSDRVLKGIKKGVTIGDIQCATKILKKYKIKVYAFVMLYQIWEKDGKIKHETTLEVLKTLFFIISMRIHGLISFFSWGFATPYPGSELFDICNKYKLIKNSIPLYKIITPHIITINIPDVPKYQMVIMRSIGIFLQSILFIFSLDSYNLNTLSINLRHAIYKMKSLLAID